MKRTTRHFIVQSFIGLCVGDIGLTWFQHSDGWHQIPLIVLIFLFALWIGSYTDYAEDA